MVLYGYPHCICIHGVFLVVCRGALVFAGDGFLLGLRLRLLKEGGVAEERVELLKRGWSLLKEEAREGVVVVLFALVLISALKMLRWVYSEHHHRSEFEGSRGNGRNYTFLCA